MSNVKFNFEALLEANRKRRLENEEKGQAEIDEMPVVAKPGYVDINIDNREEQLAQKKVADIGFVSEPLVENNNAEDNLNTNIAKDVAKTIKPQQIRSATINEQVSSIKQPKMVSDDADLPYYVNDFREEIPDTTEIQEREILTVAEKQKARNAPAITQNPLADDKKVHMTRELEKEIELFSEDGLFVVKEANRPLDTVLLTPENRRFVNELIEEQVHKEKLYARGVSPRNRILLMGPPGNGKTTLAEAIAYELGYLFCVASYDAIMSNDPGYTVNKLTELFDFANRHSLVLFFDEFETLGQERSNEADTSSMKRVVSTMLLQMDKLSSDVVFIGATNHEWMVDSAMWRRFEIKLDLIKPKRNEFIEWFKRFEERYDFDFQAPYTELANRFAGKSYAEAEVFALSVLRQSIIHPEKTVAQILEEQRNFRY